MRLKLTGMPLIDIKRYAELRAHGENTLQQRLEMLKLHQERLVAKMNELSTNARVLDDKICLYEDMLLKSTTSIRKGIP